MPAESPLTLMWGWGEEAMPREENTPGTASPCSSTQCWLGTRVPRVPPIERKAGSVTSVARIEMVGRAGQMAEGGETVERAEY